jgi:dUTP pyrophosphatase
MVIKFNKLNQKAEIPKYETPQSSGMDIRACLESPMLIRPMERVLVPTGLAVELENGFEVQVRARSGLALKNGISLVNGIGTIDSDYRGEIGVILVNLGQEDFIINNGDRIAQLVIARYEKPDIIEESKLSKSTRQAGGFGSTGLN